MIYAPRMLLIGSTGRNSGKTLLACRIIESLRDKHHLDAAKVTAVQERDGQCPRGGEGCGVCSSLDGRYCLTEETDRGSAKDTQRMLTAGAEKVYWLRVLKAHLEEGARKLLERQQGSYLVCESNSLRAVVEPGLFLMCRNGAGGPVKASATSVEEHVDRVVNFDGKEFDDDVSLLRPVNGQWAFPHVAAAVILAGGKSSRMGRDKRLLPIDGKPCVQHMAESLSPHFEKVMVSSSNAETLVPGVDTVVDVETGKGPLMGILSAMEASQHEVFFVTACDMPAPDPRLIRRMFRQCGRDSDVDAFVAMTPRGSQPLFGIYRKRIVPALRREISGGRLGVTALLSRIRTAFVATSTELPNLNTAAEYAQHISKEYTS